MASSSRHGLPGTWAEPSTFPEVPTGSNHLYLGSDPSGGLWLSESDGRDADADHPDRWSIYLTRSCDGGGTWLSPQTRVDSDELPYPGPSYGPRLSVSSLGRAHVAWMESAEEHPSLTSLIRYAAFDAEPVIRPLDLRCATSCARGLYFLEAVGGGQASCPAPAYQWSMDGTPVAGATDSTLLVPGNLPPGTHQVSYTVACGEPLPCGSESAAFAVEVLDEPWEMVDYEIEAPIRVAHEDDQLRLSWTDLEWRTRGYHIYAGSLEGLHRNATYDHAALACAIPRPDLAAVDFERLVPMQDGNAYFLVGAAGCRDEGSLGESSRGEPRPVPGEGPPCGGMR